jgi:hypothetical protein
MNRCIKCGSMVLQSLGPWQWRCFRNECHFAWDSENFILDDGSGKKFAGIMRYLKGDDRNIGAWNALEVPKGTLAVFSGDEIK